MIAAGKVRGALPSLPAFKDAMQTLIDVCHEPSDSNLEDYVPVADLLDGLADAMTKKGIDDADLCDLIASIGLAQEGWEIEDAQADIDDDDDNRPSLGDLGAYAEPEDIEDEVVEKLEKIYNDLGVPIA